MASSDTQRFPALSLCNMDSESAVKTRRVSKPKVRSGCKTCKLRRVKCDETKPQCERCIRYWGSCDGYPTESTKPASVVVVTGQFPLFQPRTGPWFESDQDLQYFLVFLNVTSVTLGGAFDNYIWRGLIPQASEQEPFVRDSLVAIGALTRTMHEIQRFRRMGVALQNDEECLNTSPDHRYAILLYGKALREMREKSLSEDENIRMVLISCLLIVCFEAFHGSPASAMTHAANGVNLLHCWLEKHGIPDLSLLKSPAPHIIEDEFIYAFNRLDLQVLTFFDTRPVEYHQSITCETEHLRRMPTVFLSLRQARFYWDYIMRRCCHFLASALYLGKVDELEVLKGGRLSDDATDVPGVNTFLCPKEVPHWLESARDGYINEVSRWVRACEPLLKSFQTLEQKKTLGFLGSTVLKIHSITTRIMLAGAFFDSEIGYDEMLPEFQELYHLAESIYYPLIASAQDKVSYHFDPSVIPSLFILLTRCRDKLLRRQAIRLLCSSFHREGTWDSLAIARVGSWIMAIEERGVETEHIPDHKRVRLTKLNVDLHNRMAQIRCYQHVNPGDTEVVWLETMLTW